MNTMTVNELRNDENVIRMLSYCKDNRFNQYNHPLKNVYIPNRDELTTEFRVIDNMYTYVVPRNNLISMIPSDRPNMVIMSHQNSPSPSIYTTL